MRIFILLLALIASSYSFAGNDYKCVVTNAIESNIEGSFDELENQLFIDKEFMVYRISGVVSVILNNKYLQPPV